MTNVRFGIKATPDLRAGRSRVARLPVAGRPGAGPTS